MVEDGLPRGVAAQKVLRAIREGELDLIEPAVSYDYGVEYPALRELGLERDEAQSVLNDLREAGILAEEVVGNLVACPRCGSHRMLLQLRCPACGSTRLTRGSVIEHLPCGYVDLEDKFRVGEDLVCPKCRKPLRAIGIDYRKPGVFYKCLECQAIFPTPRAMYTCENGHRFDEGELALLPVKAYRPTPEGRALLEKMTVNLEEELRILREMGWHVEAPAKVPGRSGIAQEFSFAGWRDGDRTRDPPDIAGELIISDNAVDSAAMLTFWAKSMDTRAKHTIFMSIPGLSEEAKTLAKSYGINVVEAENASELQARIRSLLRDLTRGTDAAKEDEGGARGSHEE
ncbi:hypothetical protein [Conexivisphaera calida]|uniref:Thaumarchaeal output domain-containing protein n=1 Tax=Conexivisphaera calida TaxID=1874277 RepID=A0A4P2VDW8_9ARCH|nr:hypothetical protein [Conexivisphaera calida]BBE42032.1 hypothetical protein NAS2_0643 [Conexivisphaera calida]